MTSEGIGPICGAAAVATLVRVSTDTVDIDSVRSGTGGGAGDRSRSGRLRSVAPGLALTAAVAAAATVAGSAVPAFGAPLFAIVMGAVVAVARPLPPAFSPGLAFGSKPVLQASVVILGSGLSIAEVLRVGVGSLPVLIGTLAAALLLARPVGRALGLHRDVTTLIGVGTAICGASAIAATNSVIDAEETDVTYAVTTIFLFNVVALLSYPALGHALGMSQHAFGLWAGTAVNDLSSVVAAATVYGHAATTRAVVVKLTRTLAIVPISVGLAAVRARRPAGPGREPTGAQTPVAHTSMVTVVRRAVPRFLLGFIALAAVNSAGLIPGSWHAGLSEVSTWLITAALAAIGLSTRPAAMRRAGWRPLLLGAVLWAAVGVSSLLLQGATGLMGL